MPTEHLLRFCICSLLIFTLVFDTAAQRASRRRSPATIDTSLMYTYGGPIEKTKPAVSQETIVHSGLDPLDKDILLTKKVSPSQNAATIPDCRETKSINKSDIADSYPYISGDGLRLYFTSNREGGHGRFFISTRESIHEPFGKPKVLSPHLTDGFYAGTLTADELTLCMANSGDLYISTRADRNAEFSVPVKLGGADDNYHFGPSISADGKEILVTVTVNDKDRTRVYKRTGTNTVEMVKEMVLPEGLEAGPGQLSKDGLSYYLSIETKTSEHLWRYSRKTTSDEFGELAELAEQVKGLKNIIQPTLSADESVMLFVTSENDIWEGDDIFLVNTGKIHFDRPTIPDSVFADAGNSVRPVNKIPQPQLPTLDYVDPRTEDSNSPELTWEANNAENTRRLVVKTSTSQLKVYPNPFTSVVNIEMSELPANGALVSIYDEAGKIIKQQKITNTRTAIPLERSLAGAYTYQVWDARGNLISSGKLIKVR